VAETFTYDESYPTTKDKVRALIPDKNVSVGERLLSDEQINLAIAIHGDGSDLRLHVAECCDMIATELGRHAKSESISVGSGLSVTTDRSPQYFADKAKRLRKEVQDNVAFYDISAYEMSRGEFGRDNGIYINED